MLFYSAFLVHSYLNATGAIWQSSRADHHQVRFLVQTAGTLRVCARNDFSLWYHLARPTGIGSGHAEVEEAMARSEPSLREFDYKFQVSILVYDPDRSDLLWCIIVTITGIGTSNISRLEQLYQTLRHKPRSLLLPCKNERVPRRASTCKSNSLLLDY
jgi:hypothetical protein